MDPFQYQLLFHARQYDPQIGRFNSLDPMDQFASGYVGMGYHPANLVDPSGMQTIGSGSPHTSRDAERVYNPFYDGTWSTTGVNPLTWDYFRINGMIAQGGGSVLTMGEIARIYLNQQPTSIPTGNGGAVNFEFHNGSFGYWATSGWGNKSDGITVTSTFVTLGGIGNNSRQVADAGWVSGFGKGNASAGVLFMGIENTPGSFRLTNGAYNGSALSPKYYASGWKGGSKARIATYNVGKLGKTLGYGATALGTIVDIYGVSKYTENPNSPNAVHPGKAALNLGMAAYGIWVNPVAGAAYSLTDAFYPGGFGNGYDSGFLYDQKIIQFELNRISNAGPYKIRLVPFGAK